MTGWKKSATNNIKADEAEARRQWDLRRQNRHERRARLWAELHRECVNGVRAVFVFLPGLTVLVLVISHLAEIDSVSTQKISLVAERMKSHIADSTLRQSALNLESEVNDAAR